MRENSVCAKTSCIQVIILFLEIEFEFSLHENSVHMSKYTIFRNRVQATQLELRIELSWLSSTQLNSNLTTGLDTAVLSTTKNNVDSIDNAASIHVQKQSAVINMKESDANDTAVLSTTKNNIDSADNAASIHVQKQSAIINMKESDANDTTVLSTTKNNVDSADNAARSDRFVKSVHSQRIDKSEDLTNKTHTLLYFSWKWSRFNHSKKDTTSITLADQTLHYSKSLKYVYEWQINDK